MTQRRNPDIRRIDRFLTGLKKANWLGTARRWWPDYLFHYTDIQNAVSILKTGALLSRVEALQRGLMVTDNASQEIIDTTDEEWKNHVRLYFRPRTPTQFRNEGFRPQSQLWQGAHCPIPIYFLFDSRIVLSRADSHFTDGNLAANPKVYSDIPGLEQIPFEYVYHDSYISDDMKAQIIFHRHAEVIVQKQMSLSALRYIVCRSQAEYETFLYLLNEKERRLWGGKIGISNRMNLFHKRWTYVQSVELESSKVMFHFNKAYQHQDQGAFHAHFSITDTFTGKTLGVWDNQSFAVNNSSFRLNLSNGPYWDYSARLLLDSRLAFADRYQDDDLPW